MKRLLLILLALSLCYASASASAEGLRVLDMGWDECGFYQEAYPGRVVEKIEAEYDDNGRSNAQSFLLQNPDGWDVAFIWTDQCDLAALSRAGLLMDLSGESALAQQVGGMYPAIRQVVTDGERLLAIPAYLSGAVMQFNMVSTVRLTDGDVDIRGRLGLTEAHEPRTFDELCALAKRYMELPKDTRRGTVFHIDAAASDAKNYFLAYFIELYTGQYSDEAGKIEYDTAEFRHGLESLETLATALEGEKKISYGQGGTICGLIYDAGNVLASKESPLYLRVGENKNIPARLGMLVVNANTERKAEALDFIGWVANNHEVEQAPLLLTEIDFDALARRSYDETIKGQIAQGEDQSFIDEMLRQRDAVEHVYDRYRYTREAIEGYAQNVVPYLTFPRRLSMDSYATAKEYVKGKLDAEGLIAKLNGIAAENAGR